MAGFDRQARRAITGAVAIMSSLAVLKIARVKIHDLQRFCNRKGLAYQTAFACIWVVLATAPLAVLTRYIFSLVSRSCWATLETRT